MRAKEEYKPSQLVNDTLVYALMSQIKSCTGIISHNFQQFQKLNPSTQQQAGESLLYNTATLTYYDLQCTRNKKRSERGLSSTTPSVLNTRQISL